MTDSIYIKCFKYSFYTFDYNVRNFLINKYLKGTSELMHRRKIGYKFILYVEEVEARGIIARPLYNLIKLLIAKMLISTRLEILLINFQN